MSVRAKLRCHFIQTGTDGDGNKTAETVHMHAVYSSDPNNENAQWSKWTPAANLTLTVSNPAAFGKFEQGAEYFVDFTPAS